MPVQYPVNLMKEIRKERTTMTKMNPRVRRGGETKTKPKV